VKKIPKKKTVVCICRKKKKMYVSRAGACLSEFYLLWF